jgi:hypothetical protein
MITAIDTSVLIDILAKDPIHVESSRRLIVEAYDEGGLIISEVVYAELTPQYDLQPDLHSALRQLGIRLVNSGFDAAYLAGRKWAEYRRAGGTRSRMIADFLIGAHAQIHADRLLTRDRGFYASYFTDLDILSHIIESDES